MRDCSDINQTIRELRDQNVIYHFSRDYLRNVMKDAADAIEELLAFAKFVARQAIDTGDNDGVSAEILCRKLNKLGLIETDGEFWMLPEPPKGVE